MDNADYILKARYVLTLEDASEVLHNGAVVVKGNRIADVGVAGDIDKKYQAKKVITGNNSVIMPGLVNTHTHAPMVYFRGMADDLPLNEWLENHIWPAEEKWLGPEFVRDATELAILEMLKAGITTYNDMYFFEDASAEAVHSMGIRAVLGSGILDFPSMTAKTSDEYFTRAENFIETWKHDLLITPCIAPHAPYTCGPETFKRAMEMADRYDIPVHTHLSETEWEVGEINKKYGMTPIEHLDSVGVLNKRVLAAHCVWVSDKEIDILAKRGVSVSHCVESNLKLAAGIAPIVKMISAGVRVSFGTDGAASNNDLDILSEMSTAARLHKTVARDPTAMDARQTVLMATRLGAEALGMGDRIGSIKKGYLADLIFITLDKCHLTPVYDIYSHIVYTVKAADVEHVLVDGKLVINKGYSTQCAEEDVFLKARTWAEKIMG